MMGSKPLLLIRMDGIKFLQLHGQMYEAREGLSYVNGEGVRIHPSGIKNISYYKPPMEHP
ncbi:hypothetical protein FACS189459_2290 [Bacilli bacterium]|nr:hypothetical protein FACS189459_2290 [Bacilli bacterium]